MPPASLPGVTAGSPFRKDTLSFNPGLVRRHRPILTYRVLAGVTAIPGRSILDKECSSARRILPAGQSLAAQFMYEDVDGGSRITFYVRVGENGESALRFARQGKVEAFYWVDDGCGYVVSGSVERERLKLAAESALEQLEHASKKG